MPYESDEEVVVIVSETPQRWINSLIRSGLHWITRSRDMDGDEVPERWSLAYFNKADRRVNVGPIPRKEFSTEDKQLTYEDL